MIKPDEIRLLGEIKRRAILTPRVDFWKVAEELSIPDKRAVYILDKISKKNWLFYSWCPLNGSLTREYYEENEIPIPSHWDSSGSFLERVSK